jgi:hypothetical protein
MKKPNEELPEEEALRRYRATLASVLAAAPDHRTKAKPETSPKKRGRPPKAPFGKSQEDGLS